jgi:hypothetical protein
MHCDGAFSHHGANRNGCLVWKNIRHPYHTAAPNFPSVHLHRSIVMNQDSIALAGALAQTLKDGNERRIDEWAVDRHKIATSVVAFTDRMTRVATLKSSVGKGIRNQLLP